MAPIAKGRPSGRSKSIQTKKCTKHTNERNYFSCISCFSWLKNFSLFPLLYSLLSTFYFLSFHSTNPHTNVSTIKKPPARA